MKFGEPASLKPRLRLWLPVALGVAANAKSLDIPLPVLAKRSPFFRIHDNGSPEANTRKSLVVENMVLRWAWHNFC
jgi:hypothetical protein